MRQVLAMLAPNQQFRHCPCARENARWTGHVVSYRAQTRKLLALAMLLYSARVARAQTATITWGTTYQAFDGMGASTGTFNKALPCSNSGDFGPDMTQARANVLFGTGSGEAGLNLFRMQICPDGTYPDNTAAQYALTANPAVKIWGVPWTPPVAYTSSGTIYNGANCLLTADYANYANYLTAWVQHQNSANVPIYMLSVQNEPDYTTSGNQPVCGWNASEFDNFIANYLGPAFSKAGLTTKIAIPETSNYNNMPTYAGTCIADTNCVKYLGFVTSHIYSGTISLYSNAYNAGLHIWETEIYSGSTFDGSMSDALTWATQIHDFFTVANASAWHYWLLLGNFGDNEPLDNIQSGDEYASRLWVMGNWSKYIQMGWLRMAATAEPQNGVYVTAWRSTSTNALTIVAINTNTSQTSQTFSLSGAPTFASVTPIITSSSSNLVPESSVSVSGNAFTYSLPAQSVVTFTGTASKITLVQHTSVDAGTTSSASLAFKSNNTAGNWIGVCVRAGAANETITVTDSNGNTYDKAIQTNQTTDGDTLAIYYAQDIKGGANTVTVSLSASNTLRFAILEYSGVATSGSLDVTAAAQGDSSSPNSGNATTTASGDLLLGALMTADPEAYTAGSGYKIEESQPAEPNSKLIAEDGIQASAGSVSANASLGAADLWAAALAAFKAAP